MTKIGEIAGRRALAGLFVFFGFLSFARAMVSVQASYEPQSLGVGEELVYTVTVLSSEIVQVEKPRPPDLKGFELLEASESSSVAQKMVQTPTGMNWENQRRKMFHYRLRATRAGQNSIGAFDVTVDGKGYHTQPTLIKVSAQPVGRRARPQGSDDEDDQMPGFNFPGMKSLDDIDKLEEDMYNQLLQRRQRQAQPPGGSGGAATMPDAQFRSLPKNPNEAFFIQVEVDKTDVYEGEQITVNWYIYTRGQMETLDRVKFPDLRGFWKEIIEEVPTIQFSEEIVNGVPYRKALLASHALFPLKPGTAIIDEYKIKARVRLPTQGFGGYSFGNAYEYTKSSQEVKINVKPLPIEGRPSSFTGAVGSFDVHASVDAETVVVGQPFTVHVRFEGSGNAKGIELPAIEWPKTVEVYDTKSDSRFFKNGRSYKQFDVLVIPRQVGELEIPPFDFGIFDPATGKYTTKSSEALHLKAVENPNAPASGTTTPSGPVTTPGKSPAPAGPKPGEILPDPVLSYRGASVITPVFDSPWFWVVLFGAIAGALSFKARAELFTSQRRRDLDEIFRRRWKKFEKDRAKNDHRRMGADMVNLFSLVLGGIAGEQGASEEAAKMMERVPPSLRREYGDQILNRIEIFQTLAFAPEEALGVLKNPERLEKEVKDSYALLTTLVKRLTEENEG